MTMIDGGFGRVLFTDICKDQVQLLELDNSDETIQLKCLYSVVDGKANCLLAFAASYSSDAIYVLHNSCSAHALSTHIQYDCDSTHIATIPILFNPSPSPSSTASASRCYSSPAIRKVCCGERHVLAIDERGEVFAWGDNDYGQLGVTFSHNRQSMTNSCTNETSIHRLIFDSSLRSMSDGGINDDDNDNDDDDDDGGGGGGGGSGGRDDLFAIDIAAGSLHSIIVMKQRTPGSDGSKTHTVVFSCGWNCHGQLGIGTNLFTDSYSSGKLNASGGDKRKILHRITALDEKHVNKVAAGIAHSLAATSR